MKLSQVKRFFDSDSFAEWKKAQEHEHKVYAAIMSRQDAMIAGLENVSKMLRNALSKR